MRTNPKQTVVPLAVAWQLHCGACGEPVQTAEPDGWDASRSFTTRLRFTLERHGAGQHRPTDAAPADPPNTPTDPRDAAVISGRYNVSYNAQRCTLTLTGTLAIDGRHYVVDDVLTMDLASMDDGAGADNGSPGTVPPLPIERLAGLAVMTHLGLRDPRG